MKLNQIYCGNCVELMTGIQNDFIDLVVTSPPYDNLRNYKGYEFDYKPIARELYRILKQGGVVAWVVSDATLNGSETGSSFKQALYFKEIGFLLYDTMIWHKPSIPKTHRRYEQAFEFIFIFSKGVPKTFNAIKILSHCAGQKHNRGKIEKTAVIEKNSASAGIAKLKLARFIRRSKEYRIHDNIFYYPVGGGQTNSITKDNIAFEHPAPFPEQLAYDNIFTWSNENDIVLDPMCGGGTTLKMAKYLNRKFIGFDISKEYCDIARRRVDESVDSGLATFYDSPQKTLFL